MTQTYLLLFAAIGFEILGTMLLPVSQNFSKIIPTIALIISYTFSFYLLATVSQKLPLSIVYASWSGIGIFSIAILSYIFLKELITTKVLISLIAVCIGIYFVKKGGKQKII